MTKKSIAEKLRHYSTLLAASLFAFVLLCPSIGFSDTFVTSDGKISCTILYGRASCVALTDDVDLDCMARIQSLFSITAQIEDSAYFVNLINGFNRDDAVAGLDSLSNISPDYSEEYDYQVSKHAFENIIYDCDAISNRVDSLISANVSSRDVISSFSCTSCADSDMSCCCCSNGLYYADFSLQLTNLLNVCVALSNSVDDVSCFLGLIYSSLTNISTYIGPLRVSSNSSFRFSRMNLRTNGSYGEVLNGALINPNDVSSRNVLTQLYYLRDNLSITQSSINNYLGYIKSFQLSSISNNVDHLYIDSTNFFSFFRSSVVVKSVLGDHTGIGSYYAFLTNHYIKVSRDDFGGMSDSQLSKTNWFSRIETLIASLVFSDSVESTNTVDFSQAESESSNILSETFDGINDVKNVSSSQLSVLQGTSQNIITSLRSISSSFSSVADPGTVNLVRLSSSETRASSDTVSFETSEIRNLIEACHCVTSFCWCFGGLLFLYQFFHWTVMTSYSLVMFAWGVFSSIFKH